MTNPAHKINSRTSQRPCELANQVFSIFNLSLRFDQYNMTRVVKPHDWPIQLPYTAEMPLHY